jgi:hypothetical protein
MDATALSYPRRLLATAGLAVLPGYATFEIARSRGHVPIHEIAVVVAMFGASLTALHASVLAQIVARGVAVFFLVLSSLAIALGGGEALVMVAGLGALVALVSLRGSLASSDARRVFAPVRARNGFLAACTALVAVSPLLLLAVVEAWTHHHRRVAVVSCLFLVAALSSALGIVRMRAWGVFSSAGLTLAAAACAFAVTTTAGAQSLGIWWEPERLWLVTWSLAACAGAVAIATVLWARHARSTH